MHEEDHGILWKHTNLLTGAVETRRSRRFVVSFFATIGNYDYGFFWYFYLDGTIELEAKATGIVFTAGGLPGTTDPHASEIAPGLFAPYHQHLFCARLDMEVAGAGNSVDEIDMVGVPSGPDNPYGNAFTTRATPLASESEGSRMADPASGRVWRISNPSSRNAVGAPRAYHLHPHGSRPCSPSRSPRSRTEQPSPAGTCGSPGSTSPSATPRASAPTSTPVAPVCRPGRRRTARSSTPTSCSGTSSDRRTSRAPRTGR